jgi:hypothetical protein
MEISFNIERIVKIVFEEERPTNYVFVEKKPIKYFFGLIDSGEWTEECWLNKSFTIFGTDSEEYLIKSGFKIYPLSERVENRVCCKARVEVLLTDGYSVLQEFDTNEEAEKWARKLKAISGSNFETIKK